MKQILSHRFLLAALLVVMAVAGGCQKVYYGTMEKFGYHKRDILVDRVTDARDAQDEAKTQFSSALEEFTSVVNVEGGKLEQKYKTLNAAYEESRDKAETVKDRIRDVKRVAEALFKEWQGELDEYTNDTYRKASARELDQTRKRYTTLISAMENAESKIEPVLAAFHDQVLFLKHNLNAQAIASLQGELATVENDIGILIREMEKSIDEANAFIQEMTQQES
ncbi:MAG: DUF2959 domain-containing protein [Planctomycetota bacterium]|jgi:hypothetical protein